MELIDKNVFLDKFLESYNKGLVCENVSTEICDSHETCVECIIETIPLIDAVPRCVLDQIRWERDVAMAQLEEIGVAFLEKTDDVVRVVRCKDCKCWGNELNWGGRRRGVCDFYEILTDADGYCYRAKRKEVKE